MNNIVETLESRFLFAVLPLAPTGIIAETISGKVRIGWIDNSSNESSYLVQRRYHGESVWKVIAALPLDSLAYSDTSSIAKVNYDYRIVARNSAGDAASDAILVSTWPVKTPATGTASISGSVFLDSNYSTKREPGEIGAGRRIVYVDTNNNAVFDAGETSIATDYSGNFTLSNLRAGKTIVRLEEKADYYQSTPGNNASIVKTLKEGQAVTGLVFGTQLIPSRDIAAVSITGAASAISSSLHTQIYTGINVVSLQLASDVSPGVSTLLVLSYYR